MAAMMVKLLRWSVRDILVGWWVGGVRGRGLIMEDLYIVGWEETDRVSKSTSPPAMPLPLQHLHLLQGEGKMLCKIFHACMYSLLKIHGSHCVNCLHTSMTCVVLSYGTYI